MGQATQEIHQPGERSLCISSRYALHWSMIGDSDGPPGMPVLRRKYPECFCGFVPAAVNRWLSPPLREKRPLRLTGKLSLEKYQKLSSPGAAWTAPFPGREISSYSLGANPAEVPSPAGLCQERDRQPHPEFQRSRDGRRRSSRRPGNQDNRDALHEQHGRLRPLTAPRRGSDRGPAQKTRRKTRSGLRGFFGPVLIKVRGL
jgi:hypothetical protein